MTFKTKWMGSLVAMALVAGCGGGQATQDVDAELCEHLAEGPAVTVSAVASGDASGAAVSDDHKRYDISLVSGAGMVSFAVDHPGELVFGLGEDVPMAITNPDGSPVPLKSQETSGLSCTEMKKRAAADLATVGTYTLTFGPSSAQKVPLVIEHGAQEDSE